MGKQRKLGIPLGHLEMHRNKTPQGAYALKYQVKVTPATFPSHSSTISPMINPFNSGQLFIPVDYFLFRKGF